MPAFYKEDTDVCTQPHHINGWVRLLQGLGHCHLHSWGVTVELGTEYLMS